MNQRGQTGSVLTVVLLSVSFLFLALSIGFGAWAYKERGDYKDRSDQKSAQAVEKAEAEQRAKLQKEFAEQEKVPSKTYTGPNTYGSVQFAYPKTWSAYIDETGQGNEVVSGYLHPTVVPNLKDTAFALRITIVNTAYDQVVKSFDSDIKNGKIKATAYVPKLLEANKSVVPGLLLTGEVEDKKQGSMILVKVRDKTLKLWTESPDFVGDFNNIVLPSLTFIP